MILSRSADFWRAAETPSCSTRKISEKLVRGFGRATCVATRKAHRPPLPQLASEVEKTVSADASDGRTLSLLAMVDAGLGRQEQAVQEAEQACDLEPFENFGQNAPLCVAIWPRLCLETVNWILRSPRSTH